MKYSSREKKGHYGMTHVQCPFTSSHSLLLAVHVSITDMYVILILWQISLVIAIIITVQVLQHTTCVHITPVGTAIGDSKSY